MLDIGAWNTILNPRHSYGWKTEENNVYDLSYNEAKNLVEFYLNPQSTFFWATFGEPPEFGENTRGERLKAYFEND